jgi:DNA-binding response OmpR family regulator
MASEALSQLIAPKPDVSILVLSLPDILGETLATQIRQLPIMVTVPS